VLGWLLFRNIAIGVGIGVAIGVACKGCMRNSK
jgi:hypothetical protein